MTPEQTEALIDLIATMDRRLAGFSERFVHVEANMADSATATENIAKNGEQLVNLVLALDSRVGNIEALLSNYVTATKGREQQARKTEEAAKGLVSEIRKRFPDLASGEG